MNKFIKVVARNPSLFRDLSNDDRVTYGAVIDMVFTGSFIKKVKNGKSVRVSLSKATAHKMVIELMKAIEAVQEVETVVGVSFKPIINASKKEKRNSRYRKRNEGEK
jgi:hypothetical protein